MADYILHHFDECAFQTSGQIGEQAGVSETTVIRLAVSLDFGGFSGMQRFIRSGLIQSRIDRVGGSSPELRDERALLARVAELDTGNIDQTLKRTSPAELRRAAKLLLAAPAVGVIGMRSSAATALYLTAALNQLFGNAIPLSLGLGDSLDRLRGMAPASVIVGISFLRYARHTFDLLRVAQQLGLRTIVITDSVTAPPARFADVLLVAASSSVHFLPSQAAGLSLANALLASIALRGRDRVVASLARFERAITDTDVFCERA